MSNSLKTIVQFSIGYRCGDEYYQNFIPYSGGLCDVVKGIAERTPYNVIVYTRRKDKPWVNENELGLDSVVNYYPAPNVRVIGVPAVKLLKWEEEILKNLNYLYIIPMNEKQERREEIIREIDYNATILKRLIKGYDGIKIDNSGIIIHAHDWLNAASLYLIKKHYPKTKTIFQVHLSSERKDYLDTRLVYEKIGCEFCDRVVAVSNSQAKTLSLHNLDEKKIIVIPNAIDTRKWAPPSTELEFKEIEEVKAKYGIKGPYILSTGRYVEEKGHIPLLLASSIFLKEHPDFYLVIAGFNGSRNLYNLLEERRRKMENNIRERIILFPPETTLNEREEIRLNQGCEAYACLSYFEAFGLVAIKAMACGKPVVASDIPTFEEVVGDSGIRVKINLEEIADGLEKAVEGKNYYGERAKVRVKERFSWDVIAKEYKKLYDELYEM
ncbi:MAG: glycosyltransferase family 4 protein [Candidatus Aenigmatarchaeota archaeon]